MDDPADLVITGASRVVLCDPDAPDGIGVLDSAAVAVKGETIVAVGPDAANLAGPATRVVDAAGGTVTPGLVDCHTHLVFEGDRSAEYFARTTGLDDAGLTAAGHVWGVPASQRINKAVAPEVLAATALGRARKMLLSGTTTIETKSGYGLDHASDIASLEAARLVAEISGLEVVPTYLGAHARPDDAARYLDTICAETIPEIAERNLATFCDVYVDPNVFTIEECARVLAVAADHGLVAKLHTDARVNVGGARLAVEMGAASVDHANMLSDDDLDALAEAGTAVAFFPGFDWAVNHPHPVDARRFCDHGVTVAIATDLCPVCWHLSQQMTMGFACRLSGLTADEALMGATINAARALRLDARIGSLAAGKQADIAVFDTPDHARIPFRFGANSARTVIKKGRVLVEDGRLIDRSAMDQPRMDR
ncbi:imidazolonepropionase [Acuticoccus sediminis]|uniref:Imidazolonepropionase n=1 Tax=Acuticoccus sediminis TaxID=2184697 RepID=A0A8B2NQT2_9HYPH|nr:imidazolonepropionase [Acuticoccus sediminis]RAI02255.1 imidazolonepropionase [Acuticoccus sediminis]